MVREGYIEVEMCSQEEAGLVAFWGEHSDRAERGTMLQLRSSPGVLMAQGGGRYGNFTEDESRGDELTGEITKYAWVAEDNQIYFE